MADAKISALPASTTPLSGTEVLPIVQSGATVKVASNDLTVKNFRSNATTGILQVAGPIAGATRIMTTPDANFTAARTDAAQTFTGTQTFSSDTIVNGHTIGRGTNDVATNFAAGSGVFANTSGASGNSTGVGYQALNAQTTASGGYNTAFGSGALKTVTTGYQNTAIGGFALNIATGNYNVALGAGSGSAIESGSNNVLIGSFDGNGYGIDIRNSNSNVILSTGDGIPVIHVDSLGNQKVISGNLVIGTSGKGIDFSATPGAGTSELLDDYEEGTWTPTLAPTTGSFASITYGLQYGNYTKIGNTVRVEFGIATNALDIGTGSGIAQITGLPFVHTSAANTSASGVVGLMIRFATDFPVLGALVSHNTSTIYFQGGATSGNGVQLQVSDLNTATVSFRNYITGCIVYKTT